MRIACISFTSSGKEISKRIKYGLTCRVQDKEAMLSKTEKNFHYRNEYVVTEIDKNTFSDKLSNHMEDIFRNHDGLIFISSTGIALRLIAPYIESKVKDPAVIVVDDMGKYSISLLSGHIRGANDLTLQISSILENQPIITTASDGRGIDAVDTFAKRYNLEIESMEDAKKLTSLMVEGENIKLISELVDVELRYDNVIKINKHSISSTLSDVKGIIVISSLDNIKDYIKSEDKHKPICLLRPKNINIGIGCRRGKSKREILGAIMELFKENNLCLKSINKIGTIDVKKDEEGIIETSKELNCSMEVFTKKDIEKVQNKFNRSKFVESKVGVTSVCEPCAYLLGSEMIISKKIFNGITIAVSRSDKIG
ncbi:cobalamin biosynthesis protein CbiG [Gottschalkia acidurici 9a]|uniref:Cobalamin biosynthesis protein CbiG n=1 Tax=Gottschalkia acidurici (strain ATCC 7906 / DSM 604 / BCRC 14475 / CIP 104303 / KCTC 5404 / NCIMB 10678 / 9a) TaxID=1128398 RepID=K0B2U6_GOTA9|nr:cobalt-precorrin 5A hydrolase [Gottschalkia acidurici]AFS79467.1 cobalamin biosynthesis protein CbiG [Gottschalkia acidurici 9a]